MHVTFLAHDGLLIGPPRSQDAAADLGAGTVVALDPWSGAPALGRVPFPSVDPDTMAAETAAVGAARLVVLTSPDALHADVELLTGRLASARVVVAARAGDAVRMALDARGVDRRRIEALPDWTWWPLAASAEAGGGGGGVRIMFVSCAPGDLDGTSGSLASPAVIVQQLDAHDEPVCTVLSLGAARLGTLSIRSVGRVVEGEVDLVVARPEQATCLAPVVLRDPKRVQMRVKQQRREGIEAAIAVARELTPVRFAVRGATSMLIEPAADVPFAFEPSGPTADGHALAAALGAKGTTLAHAVERGSQWTVAGPGARPSPERVASPAHDEAAAAVAVARIRAGLRDARRTIDAGIDTPLTPDQIRAEVEAWGARLLATGAQQEQELVRRLGLRLVAAIHATGTPRARLGEQTAGTEVAIDLREPRPAGGEGSEAPADQEARLAVHGCTDTWRRIACGEWSLGDAVAAAAVRLDGNVSRGRAESLVGLISEAWPDVASFGERLAARAFAARVVLVPVAEGVDGRGARPLAIGRFCPHANVDLVHAGELLPGRRTLRCHAHCYEFDLRDGTCLNATDCPALPLHDTPQTDTPPPANDA